MTLSMIPSGQPYGKRQETEAATADAGLSKTTAQARAPKKVERAVPQQPGGFDALEAMSPTQFGQLRQSQDARVLDVLDQSPSPFLRDLASRLRGF